MASRFARERRPLRVIVVPVASTLAGSALALLPLVAQAPLLPSFGLVMALAWRLLRPEIWDAWIALPLGLADDLIGGASLGSATALWTLAFLAIDIVDHRRVSLDAAIDWRLAAAAIAACTLGAWGLAWFSGGAGPAWTMLPQALLGVLCWPAASRLVAAMDRWRLRGDAATRA